MIGLIQAETFVQSFGANTLEAFMINNKTLRLFMTVPINNFFAVGFGSQMVNTDMILTQSRGNLSTAYDLWSTRHGRPSTDEVQDIKYGFIWNETHTTFQIDRKIDTGDTAQDFVVIVVRFFITFIIYKGEPMSMIFSYHTSSATLTKHTNKGGFTMTLIPPIYNASNQENNDSNKSLGENFTIGNITSEIYGANYDEASFHRIHGWILWLSWGPLAFIQLTTTRYMKTFTYGIWIHMLAGLLNMIATLTLGILALQQSDYVIDDNPHSQIGVSIMVIVIAVNFTGVIMRMRIFRRFRIYWIHKVMGYSILIVAQIQLVLGVLMYSRNYLEFKSPLGFIHVGIFGMFLAGIEIYHQMRLRSKKIEMKMKSRLISLYQFNQLVAHGRQFVILDDKVIDVETFFDNHPGGRSLLKLNIGRDITKFFYGAYEFKNINNVDIKNCHSSLGYQLATQMTVGRLENNYNQEYLVQLIYSSQLLGKHTKTFVFQGQELRSGMQKYYSNIGMIGRHFTLCSSKQRTLKRQYYICNCLMPKIYEQYMQLIEKFLNNKSKLHLDNSIIQDGASNRIALTVKAISKRRGLSNMIFQRQLGDNFILNGPFGKGLELQYSGVHIAFTTGQGSLAYLDLVAHLIRKNLDLLDKEEAKQLSFSDFKFIMIVCVPNKKHALGYQLCKGLVQICKRQNRENFEYKLKKIQNANQFWNEEYIISEMDQFKEAEKIWVNGPNRMNQAFDIAFKQLAIQHQQYQQAFKYEIF
ncbi:cytochrome b5-like heme steroid binding domain containing protein [Stylonychia lemnae]|uniref:Cytochrome b5-like heme steroid binding domain containing protein n=1 Tax=Stylonychia lemnae TaxID=5949 RepID=A0A078B2B1_STYLE|nr:cytochrome b5-like heme steroid binding domain containing protein [Stylonychia lemnae]|eukprot:CDW87608.1 cytochrome b5-like heme steroid binding domain containing protein [Stylonychia lemnae]